MTPSNAITDEAVLDALRKAIDEGAEMGGGGVPIEAIAERLPVEKSATRRRLKNLRSQGRVKKGWGFPPKDRPRVTYEPCRTED